MNLKNSLYKVSPSPFNKEIELPTSKSHSNRALVVGALRGNGFCVDQVSFSSDVLTLLACLKMVGVRLSQKDRSVVFHNSFPACEEETKDQVIDLKTGDGGTTNRFLAALLSRGKKRYRFFPSGKMSERPIADLLGPLEKLGVKVEVHPAPGPWISIQGPAHIDADKALEIDCIRSSQFATALMLAFSDTPITFDLKNLHASKAYVEMTKSLLAMTRHQNHYLIPIDFSSLSYPLCLAIVDGSVLLKNVHTLDPYQADAELVSLLKAWGGDIEWTSEGLKASSKKKLNAFQVDGAKFPDLIPALAFLAAHIEGESVLTNLGVLRHKESDRIEQLLSLLKIFSVSFSFVSEREEIRIQGKSMIYPEAHVHLARDHRMVMTAYLFLRKNSGGSLDEVDCIEKSFPDFLECMT
ncbi:MAG: hypothetical protein KBD76_12515 [Bacteriovorax sp.]|nr:hypothetical protein [Bacteriovorax sp.]